MSASAFVQQMVRAHYMGDEQAFSNSALSLARSTKIMSVSRSITDMVRNGRVASRGVSPVQQMRALTAPPSKLLQPLLPVGFDELMLPVELQLQIDEIVQEIEYRDELMERKLRARNRILFHGPPGNGKTSAASAIATTLQLNAWGVSLPQTIGTCIGETEKNLGEIFASLTPSTIVVIDEIDALGAERGGTGTSAGKSYNSIVNAMLTLMDRNKNGIIIATTNRRDIIDSALLRRFDEQMFFPQPTVEQMRSLASRLTDSFGVAPIGVDDCANFDEVTKRITTEARRSVMREILAAEQLNEEDSDDVEETED